MLIYLYKGTLPWCHMKCKSIFQTLQKILELKKSIPPEKLCEDMPPEFCEYLKYINNLTFEQEPNYKYLRSLFLNILAKNGMKNDCIFSWYNRNIIPNRIKYSTRNNSLNRIYSNLKLLKTINNTANNLTANITEKGSRNKMTIEISHKSKDFNNFSDIIKVNDIKNEKKSEIKEIDNENKQHKRINNFILNKQLNKKNNGNKQVIFIKKDNDFTPTNINNNDKISNKNRMKI